MAKVFLVVGLPGSGKSTRARRLAIEHHALRLTPDDWMIPLFGEPAGDGKRDVLEAASSHSRCSWYAWEPMWCWILAAGAGRSDCR
jgi:predicted kinase